MNKWVNRISGKMLRCYPWRISDYLGGYKRCFFNYNLDFSKQFKLWNRSPKKLLNPTYILIQNFYRFLLCPMWSMGKVLYLIIVLSFLIFLVSYENTTLESYLFSCREIGFVRLKQFWFCDCLCIGDSRRREGERKLQW